MNLLPIHLLTAHASLKSRVLGLNKPRTRFGLLFSAEGSFLGFA